jgi:hypothetical protein
LKAPQRSTGLPRTLRAIFELPFATTFLTKIATIEQFVLDLFERQTAPPLHPFLR